ncbi:MAG: MATE family efflux transporter, partial [Planctomycetales bacterium]|nr:MATE family efflux transporter [Planctomycetales bacterium]
AVAARRVGEGRPAEAGAAAREALRLALYAGAPVALLAYAALGPVLAGGLADPGVRVASADYLRPRLLGLPLVAAIMALRGFLYGAGRPSVDLVATVVSNLANVALSLWLVFGGLGIPALGVSGAALGTVAAEGLHLVTLAVWVGAAPSFAAFRVRGRGMDRSLLGRVARVSSARALQGLSLAGISVWFAILEKTGVVEAAAANVVFAADGLFWFIGMGIGVAAGTLAAQSLGSRDPAGARRFAVAGARVIVASMAVLALAAIAVAGPFLGLFTTDPKVRAAAFGPFIFSTLLLPLDALGAGLARILIGTGSATYVLAAEIGCSIVLLAPLSWALAFPLGGGAWGAWAAWGVYAVAWAAAMGARLRGEAWTRVSL